MSDSDDRPRRGDDLEYLDLVAYGSHSSSAASDGGETGASSDADGSSSSSTTASVGEAGASSDGDIEVLRSVATERKPRKLSVAQPKPVKIAARKGSMRSRVFARQDPDESSISIFADAAADRRPVRSFRPRLRPRRMQLDIDLNHPAPRPPPPPIATQQHAGPPPAGEQRVRGGRAMWSQGRPHCVKRFSTGQALAGHTASHRVNRWREAAGGVEPSPAEDVHSDDHVRKVYVKMMVPTDTALPVPVPAVEEAPAVDEVSASLDVAMGERRVGAGTVQEKEEPPVYSSGSQSSETEYAEVTDISMETMDVTDISDSEDEEEAGAQSDAAMDHVGTGSAQEKEETPVILSEDDEVTDVSMETAAVNPSSSVIPNKEPGEETPVIPSEDDGVTDASMETAAAVNPSSSSAQPNKNNSKASLWRRIIRATTSFLPSLPLYKRRQHATDAAGVQQAQSEAAAGGVAGTKRKLPEPEKTTMHQ